MADKPKRRTNAVYLNGGPISQIKNFPFKKVYHGTRIPLEIDDEGNAIIDGPFFVTPYQSIACIFVARRNTEETLPPETKGPIRNITYEEWSKPNNEILSKVTEYVEYMDDTHFDDIVSHEKGYLYEFDVDDYVKEHVFQSAKMTMQSKTHEYCIDHVSKLKVAKTTPLDIELTIKPRKYVDRKHRPFSESYIPDDATSGTSDFDEKDDDPEDCFCESTNINEGCDNMPLSEFDHYFQEAKMKAKTRKELDDSDFALVYKDASGNKVRKYPINDEAHVKAAARMFPRGVPNKYRKEVAGKILRRAHKFGIDTEGWKSLNNAVKD